MTDATTPKIVEPEGGHFYSIRAELISTVPSADRNKQEKSTLRHARTKDLARGLTSDIRSCDKPALFLLFMGGIPLESFGYHFVSHYTRHPILA